MSSIGRDDADDTFERAYLGKWRDRMTFENMVWSRLGRAGFQIGYETVILPADDGQVYCFVLAWQ